MQDRANATKKIATIKFSLINQEQYHLCDNKVSATMEKLSPAFADHLCATWGVEVKQLSAKLFRNQSRAVFGCELELTVLLDETKQQLDAAALLNEINAAMPPCISNIDPDFTIFKFDLINPEQFSVTLSDEPTDNMSFKGKVGKREYSYTSLDETESLTVSFINESAQTTYTKPKSKIMTYDRWNNITSITYDYSVYEPKEEDLQRLEAEAEALINDRFAGKFKPFLQSIKERQFGQALRRACTVKTVELFQLLAKYSNERVIVLNLNEFTLVTKKTALNLAVEAGNVELFAILKKNQAKTFAECATLLVEHEREEIYAQNPARKANPVTHSTVTSHWALSHKQKEQARRPQELIDEVYVEQCLRTGDSFQHYVHTNMTDEEKSNLEKYERQRREEHKQQQDASRGRGSFDLGDHHYPTGMSPRWH